MARCYKCGRAIQFIRREDTGTNERVDLENFFVTLDPNGKLFLKANGTFVHGTVCNQHNANALEVYRPHYLTCEKWHA